MDMDKEAGKEIYTAAIDAVCDAVAQLPEVKRLHDAYVYDRTGMVQQPPDGDDHANETYHEASSEFYSKIFISAAEQQWPFDASIDRILANYDARTIGQQRAFS